MNIQNQVYKLIQTRIKRICHDTWTKAPKNKKGRLKGPLTYPNEIDELVRLSSEVLDMDPQNAEAVASAITNGSMQNAYLSAQ